MDKAKKGFTLVEIMVALFVFSVLMVAVTGTFTNFIKSYISNKEIQRKLEKLQYSVAILAKTIRTSTIKDGDGETSSILVYDYSTGTCVRYSFGASNIGKQIFVAADESSCSTSSPNFGDEEVIVDEIDGGTFVVEPSRKTSDPLGQHLGKVTISIKLKTTGGSSKDVVPFQTTVSLRDYSYVSAP